MFLKGETSCSGKVGIEQGDVTFWLSGNETTWNQEAANTVCRQMHCGNASDFGSSPSVDDNIWPESYVCWSNSTSLLDCRTGPQPLGYNHSVASVTCSGNVRKRPAGSNRTPMVACPGHVTCCSSRLLTSLCCSFRKRQGEADG